MGAGGASFGENNSGYGDSPNPAPFTQAPPDLQEFINQQSDPSIAEKAKNAFWTTTGPDQYGILGLDPDNIASQYSKWKASMVASNQQYSDYLSLSKQLPGRDATILAGPQTILGR